MPRTAGRTRSRLYPIPGRVYCLYTHVRPKTQNTRAQSINTLEAHTHHSNTTVQAPSLRAAALHTSRSPTVDLMHASS